MVLCVVDDLLFSVRISTAAKAVGVDTYFERTPGAVVESVRAKRPSLVVFDLNSRKMNPLAAIAAIKGDPELKHTRLLGYVSHVDTGAISGARAAGIDEVLARSAFVERLGEILLAG